MSKLLAHLRALKIWLFFGGWHRLFFFLSTIPVLWMFWGFCSPSLASGEIDLKNTFLSLFAAWYSLSYLQDFTSSDASFGRSGAIYLPSCPALPISPLMRICAELLFFFIIAIIVFIPLFLLHQFLGLPHKEHPLSAGEFLSCAIRGTLAIGPILFCIRMNVNGAYILPATLRTALPVALCGAFFLFQITGLYTSLLTSAVLFALQVTILCTIFIWFRGQGDWLNRNSWLKFFSRYILDESVLYLLLGKNEYRHARHVNIQIALDIVKIIILYFTYWICFYFPLMAALYYLFINLLDKPVMNWFFFLVLLILPSHDSHALANRFIFPILALPVRQDRVLQWFYLLFTIGIAAIWTLAFMIVNAFGKFDHLSLLPAFLLFAPTIAGIWISRMSSKPPLALAGVLMLCSLPIGYYLNLYPEFPFPILLCAFVGAILPLKSMVSLRPVV